MKEIWKDIDGFNGKYSCSSFGKIRSNEFIDKAGHKRKPKIRKLSTESNGYFQINLSGCEKPIRVHRIIAKAFIPNPENKPFVNHINGIKTDNRVENLEWCTRSENAKHSFKIGLSCNKGENSPTAKLNNKSVLEIRSKYVKGIYSTNKLAKEYNISKTNIKDILKRKIWNHI